MLRDKVSSAKRVIPLGRHEPLEIKGKEVVERLRVRDLDTGKERDLRVDGVFIEIGLFPNSDFMLDLADTNVDGEVHVTGRTDTGVRGVFAAGDVTDNQDKQIVVAAGEGAQAAIAAFEYLISQR